MLFQGVGGNEDTRKTGAMSQDLTQYGELLAQIKGRIRKAQVKATLSANAEMILMYWDIGWMIHERQQHEGVECQDHSATVAGYSE